MMAELDQVPLWPRGGRWGERRASDGADGRKRVFVLLRVWGELALQHASHPDALSHHSRLSLNPENQITG